MFEVTFYDVAPLARLRARMDAETTSFDAPEVEVVALKAEVVELKAEVARLKAEVVELKYEDNVMREIAEETGRCGESLLVYSVDVSSPCAPVSLMREIVENMEQDGIRLTTLSSRLHQLLRQRSSASSGDVLAMECPTGASAEHA